MGLLGGKVAIVTGAGRSIGRGHALLLAKEGAAVVGNDLGGDGRGDGADLTPAQAVVAEIEAMGGAAVVNGANVADWDDEAWCSRPSRRSVSGHTPTPTRGRRATR